MAESQSKSGGPVQQGSDVIHGLGDASDVRRGRKRPDAPVIVGVAHKAGLEVIEVHCAHRVGLKNMIRLQGIIGC